MPLSKGRGQSQQVEGLLRRIAMLWWPRHATSPFIIFAPEALPEPERLASVLCDFVVEPTPHGLTNANMAKIVEHCFRQPFVIAQIEQPPRGVI